jgi:DNA-binding transcriptional ArsR family regulator
LHISESQITRIYAALGNPYRRKIVALLKTQGRLGFKDLHEGLGISVGALYHHLDMLEGVVGQDKDKKYVLTDQGRSALEALSISEEKISSSTSLQVPSETRLGVITDELLFGRSLFDYLSRDPLRSFPLAILIVILGGWLSLQTNLEPILMFYVNPTSAINKLWFVLLFPLGWLGTFAFAEALSVGLFHRKGAELSLLNGTAFAMLPLLIVPSILYLSRSLGFATSSALGVVTILPIVVQAWIICLLSASISVSKGLRMEKTAVISLGIMYINILAVIIALQLLVF